MSHCTLFMRILNAAHTWLAPSNLWCYSCWHILTAFACYFFECWPFSCSFSVLLLHRMSGSFCRLRVSVFLLCRWYFPNFSHFLYFQLSCVFWWFYFHCCLFSALLSVLDFLFHPANMISRHSWFVHTDRFRSFHSRLSFHGLFSPLSPHLLCDYYIDFNPFVYSGLGCNLIFGLVVGNYCFWLI